MLKKLLFALLAVQLVFTHLVAQEIPAPPSANREFRAAWVATVANINWPSKPGLTTKAQQDEAIALLDMLQRQNFNAVIFQVRPQADALYASKLEPWSFFLTGEQGKAPEPYYDPLEFWIEAAHDRGLELHVWLNPYRAHHIAGGPAGPASIVSKRPDLVYKLKQGYWWLDPAKKDVQDLSAAVVRDLVSRYDLDGVHFDDYFYPYEEYNGGGDFPDQDSWNAYTRGGGKLSRSDWRRENVNVFIKRVYKEIKSIRKEVKFGLSPFGIWRPGYPASVQGFDQYDKLYADAKLWLNKGWIDYFTPQIYWQINDYPHSFPVLLGWWQSENTQGRHLWPGLNSGLGGGDKNSDEVINQIMITRGMLPQSPGVIHWSIAALTKHESLRKDLLNGPYKREALAPASPWLDRKAPASPVVTTNALEADLNVRWTHRKETDVFKWIVYSRYGNNWNYRILNRKDRFFALSRNAPATSKIGAKTPLQTLNAIAVTAVDRSGNESNPVILPVSQ
ncbi:hypothetical protein C7T94_05835 [Pedobacter yulinensis]|uniref:Glycosyl hydrolase-like 10 domain-containing protein n=1 Tax=Pedobacter yulinensis TaxID=2126353 RepID=A0A2T3HPC8_9SPHI|nr:family 10 glycosylhydrolase [Pedobacter yulinensis]PST84241.1 hypothetical protein C7T94_05835 [Pedobacter yulinensis]